MNYKDLNPSLYTVKAISKEDLEKQQHNFVNFLAKSEEADVKEINNVLSKREVRINYFLL
ncbi:MAG: hypothetical protein HC939_02225 [Pleurocapsa sp. SU_5_0]|nr:hypothetical protein [Pleurocapsa sp. SU_5_0]NJO95322.1 hypothetical protein [Pleurocapsa sp. CRU_1_2]NJR45703.1 hypothetical protein [Hyellaceae cyanobacterium CSU_1_1]